MKKIIGGIVGFAVLGLFLAAVNLGADTLPNVLSWTATVAKQDENYAPFGGGHALWRLDPASSNRSWPWETVGFFQEGLGGGRDARLTGNIVNPATGDTYSTDVKFELLENYEEYVTNGTGNPKLELYTPAYVSGFTGQSGGPGATANIDPTEWRYYQLETGTVTQLTGGNHVYTLTPRPDDFEFEAQVGLGASGKNLAIGMSAWFDWTRTGNIGPSIPTSGFGDINIDLPEPGESLLIGSAAFFLGMLYWRRRNL